MRDTDGIPRPTRAFLLSDWYVNMFTVDRRKTLIFMNEQTLLSFISFGIKKSNCSHLDIILRRGIEQLLQMEAVPDPQIDALLREYFTVRYAKTDSRSALGSMNDLIFLYKYAILEDGGFAMCDVGKIIHYINRTPQRNLGWGNSISTLRRLLDEASTRY